MHDVLHLLGLEKEVVERIDIDIARSWCTSQEASPLPAMSDTWLHDSRLYRFNQKQDLIALLNNRWTGMDMFMQEEEHYNLLSSWLACKWKLA